jgi:hypothetical protein
MMIRYSKWVPPSVSLMSVLHVAADLGLSPEVVQTMRELRGGERVFEKAVFVDGGMVREKLGMTEKELEEEDGPASN